MTLTLNLIKHSTMHCNQKPAGNQISKLAMQKQTFTFHPQQCEQRPLAENTKPAHEQGAKARTLHGQRLTRLSSTESTPRLNTDCISICIICLLATARYNLFNQPSVRTLKTARVAFTLSVCGTDQKVMHFLILLASFHCKFNFYIAGNFCTIRQRELENSTNDN